MRLLECNQTIAQLNTNMRAPKSGGGAYNRVYIDPSSTSEAFYFISKIAQGVKKIKIK